ncbi:MAG: hypothetical protein V3U45_08025 [bacterium]
MAKAKQLWNVSGVLKSFTDDKGAYQVVEPWTGPKTGSVKALPEDVARLMDSGFTDRDPRPKPKKAAATAAATVSEGPAEEGG